MVHDKKAISLLHDFIREKLGGDIHKLRTFDFSSLDNDRKYGSTNHEEAPIVKAVMSLALMQGFSAPKERFYAPMQLVAPSAVTMAVATDAII